VKSRLQQTGLQVRALTMAWTTNGVGGLRGYDGSNRVHVCDSEQSIAVKS